MYVPERGRRSRRLTLEQVVDAAAEVIREDGFDGLTMRRLAERCGVGVMTLYGYVRTKEEILGAVSDRFLADLELPPASASSWQAQVAVVFRSVHEEWLAHPELAQIAVAQPIDSLAAYRGAEVVLGALRRAGFGPEEAVDAFEVLVCFTAGFTLRQLAFDKPATSAPKRLRRLAGLPGDDFPNIVELAPVFAARTVQRRFDDALEVVLRGLSAGRDDGAPAGGRAVPVRRSKR
ncbi:MAG TPA: TetR/AcrR family transcriptional regulator C-terminal domain-containing protein [Acidimicrobiia bacterium]|jgi:AcrR family transcriptional regulator